MRDVESSWSALRACVESDIEIFAALALDWPAGSADRNRFEAKAEHARQVIASMDLMDALDERTAAACDTITKAAQ